MKSASLIVLLVSLLALLLVSCESYEPPGVENAGPIGPTSEGYLVPEDPVMPQGTDAVIHRPVTDFTEAQVPQSYSVNPFGDVTGWSGHPPEWSNPSWPYPYFVLVDWTGLSYEWFLAQTPPIDLGTEIGGDIMEQSLPSGGRRVQINLNVTNAWTIARINEGEPGIPWPVVLGSNADELQPGEAPLVSVCHMQLKWTDAHQVGYDMPNLLGPWPDFNLEFWTFNSSSGFGSLTYQAAYPELTPWVTGMVGKVMVNQVALHDLSVWPVEICNVYPVEGLQ